MVLAAVIVAATVVGVLVHRRRPAAAERVAHRLMDSILWLILPIVAFFNMAALELTVQIGAGIAFAYAGLLATMLAAWLIGARLLGLSRPATGALIVSAGLANTGYLGLPFNAATLGFSALPEAVAYDVLVSGVALVTVGFSVGAAFGTEPTRGGGRLKAFFARNPALWATVAGLLAPEVLAPGAAVDASRILVVATVPIGFFAVGVALAAARPPRPARGRGRRTQACRDPGGGGLALGGGHTCARRLPASGGHAHGGQHTRHRSRLRARPPHCGGRDRLHHDRRRRGRRGSRAPVASGRGASGAPTDTALRRRAAPGRRALRPLRADAR